MNVDFIIKELNPIDYCIEETRLTLILKENELLMLHDFEDKIMFSYFINKQFQYADVISEDSIIERFKNRLDCDHKTTHMSGGIIRCSKCKKPFY